jgi:hypothetical protein
MTLVYEACCIICYIHSEKISETFDKTTSQQTVVEQHHPRTGPTSTEDVCTHIVEQTQGSTWQLKTFWTHRGIIQDTTVILSVLLVFAILFDQMFLLSFDVYRTTIFTQQVPPKFYIAFNT